jgi:RHS repeat-associated protein
MDGATYAVHSDHLNTPRRLSNDSGQAVWQWSYSAFGEDKPTTARNRFANLDTTPNPGTTSISEVKFNLRYPGQYADEESGLFYNGYRTYIPTLGRYTQGDPIGLRGGWNRFGYVGANPLSYVDPKGLQAEEWDRPRGPYSIPNPTGDAQRELARRLTRGLNRFIDACKGIGDRMFSDGGDGSGDDGQVKPPPDTIPIDETKWSGDHQGIKEDSQAGPATNVRVGPSGDVWVQQPSGSWVNTGNANDMIGGSEASGRRGKDREPPWKQERGRKQRGGGD